MNVISIIGEEKMSVRNKKGDFKKRQFLSVIKKVIRKSMDEFGYTKFPYIKENKSDSCWMMRFRTYTNYYVIEYDYQRFRRIYGELSNEDQQQIATRMIAHEMRHYYQTRQLLSDSPIESKKTIRSWLKNEKNYYVGNTKKLFSKYLNQPLEIDAETYAYFYVSREYNVVPLYSYGIKYLKKLESCYKSVTGDKKSRIFGKDVKKNYKKCK